MTLLDRLRVIAAQLDEDALATLANKGLVRRAQKDLALDSPVVLDLGDRVQVRVENWLVELLERPSDSKCECPASGTCRHILGAWMHLASSQVGAMPAPSTNALASEILAISDEELQRWAGTALLRRAFQELARGLQVEVDLPVLRIADWNVETRWLTGAGLSAMLCNCHAEGPCVHKVAAVLAFQVESGERTIVASESDLKPSFQAPRTREEVRNTVRTATEDLIAQGLARMAPSTAERLQTLATSSHGVDLPRLERILRGLADEISAWLNRSPQASEETLLARCATAHALAVALRNDSPSLVGAHKNRYERVHELSLVGVGARSWRTASGYHGLTLYFWNPATENWLTWSDARPFGTPFDPAVRFLGSGPWMGCESPSVASRSHIHLRSAWCSQYGRLSGRASVTMTMLGASGERHLPTPIDEWGALATRARRALPLGLAPLDERKSFVLIRPSAWHPATFDPLNQQLRRLLSDSHGNTMALVLPHTTENHVAISALEKWQPSTHSLLFGILHIVRGELVILPISIVHGDRLLVLGLATPSLQIQPFDPPAELLEEQDIEHNEDDDVVEFGREQAAESDPVSRLCSEVWGELESVSVRGVAAYRDWQSFEHYLRLGESLGLSNVAKALRRLLLATSSAEAEPSLASAILDTAWVVRLTQSAAIVERATRDIAATPDHMTNGF